MECIKCQKPLDRKVRFKHWRICRSCAAQFVAAGEGEEMYALLRKELGAHRSFCEECGKETSYSAEKAQGSIWCDGCGKHCCEDDECIKRVSDLLLCRTCRASRVFSD